MRKFSLLSGAAGIVLAAAAFAADHDMAGMNSASDAPSTKAYKAAMERMHHGMNIPYSGDADADFVGGMVPHHEGAVAMAKIELQYGKDPELQKLATDIIAAQDKEIRFMQAWREKHATAK